MKKFYLFLFTVVGAFSANAQCPDLFISEAAEGSSNNKYFEIYNGTGATVDLSTYAFATVSNAPSDSGNYEFWNLFDSGSMVAHGDVFIVGHPSADATILAEADMTFTFLSNGDDGMCLVKGGTWNDADSNNSIGAGEMTGFTVLDCVGDWNGDPGSGWDVAGVANGTQNHTIVRKSSATGNSNWTASAGTDSASSEWWVNPIDDWSMIGSHSADCNPPSIPEVDFASGAIWVDENAGTASLDIEIAAPSATDTTWVEVTVTGGTAQSGTHYNITSGTVFTFLPGSSTPQALTLSLVDDALANGDRTIELALINLSSNAIFAKDSTAKITIVNDDYEVAKIADIIMLDSNLKPINDGFKYEITGIVYGIDYDGNAGVSFTIIDSTDGINIFNFRDVSDYVVTEGDEIVVRGEIDFYNGLLELFADSIRGISNGNQLKDPIKVYKPSEETESDFIQLRKVWIADTTTVWPNNDNVWLTNQYQDTFQIRIDRDIVDVVGTPVLYDTMTIIGIGGQFDPTDPRDEGYQIFPRGLSDIMEYVFVPGSVKNIDVRLNAYPNPSEGTVTIASNINWNTFETMDLLGNVVAEGKVVNNQIDLNELANGYYLINVYNNELKGNIKVLISK